MSSETYYWDTLLMVSFLGYGFQHLLSKAFALLWKIWVEVESVSMLRFRLRSVCGICSDFGTEAELYELVDIVPAFLRTIGYSEPVPRETWLFPVALWMCGWHHVWDHIAQWAPWVESNSHTKTNNCYCVCVFTCFLMLFV